MAGLVADAHITVDASPAVVWDALTSREALKAFMFGSDVVSDWRVGSPISWEGEWKGNRYTDKGEVLEATPSRSLRYTHFSPLAGKPDLPENYHTIDISLEEVAAGTHVHLSQDNNATEDERRHSEENWQTMLAGLKDYVERAERER
jgi:uncharacterized protein YndB with AHSA1/START domain